MPKTQKKAAYRVSLRDIADEAKVSIGSVSSVLNNRHLERRIPHDTAEKIRATAAKLGYLPNISARRLRSSEKAKNSVILALVTSFEAPIPLVHNFVTALHQEAESDISSGYSFSLMIEMYNAGRLRDLPGLLTGDHFNAAIILNTVPEDDLFLTRSHLPYPVVMVNRQIPGYPSVEEPRESGARAAELIVGQRRSSLAVLLGSPLTQSTGNRVNSFMRRTLELTGRPASEIIADKLSVEGGYEAMKAFLASKQTCNGMYAVSDALAMGAYRAIKEAGLKIPLDIAVIGVGDYETAPFFDPPLSSVGVSHHELAARASKLLFEQLKGSTPPSLSPIPVLEMLRFSSGHSPR